MDGNTAAVVQQIAAKLGTTSEYLWGVLLKQAPIYAFTTTLEIIAMGIGIYLYAKHFNKFQEWFDDEIACGMVVGLTTVVVVVIGFVAIASVPHVITALLNPEYFAFSKILGAIKSK